MTTCRLTVSLEAMLHPLQAAGVCITGQRSLHGMCQAAHCLTIPTLHSCCMHSYQGGQWQRRWQGTSLPWPHTAWCSSCWLCRRLHLVSTCTQQTAISAHNSEGISVTRLYLMLTHKRLWRCRAAQTGAMRKTVTVFVLCCVAGVSMCSAVQKRGWLQAYRRR